MFNKKIKLLSIVVLLFFIIYVCLEKFYKFSGPAHSFPVAEVTVQQISLLDVPLNYEYAGRVSGFKEVEVKAQVSGILQAKNFTEGQFVKAGDVLFTIQPQSFQAALDRAQATLNDTKASLWKNEKNWQRIDDLMKKNAVSPQEHEQALTNLNQSKAVVEEAQAALRSAKINLDYCKVIAPISGIAGKENYSVGNLINAGILTTITQLDSVYVNFAYPDSDFHKQKKLQSEGKLIFPKDNKLKIAIKFPDGKISENEGSIDFIDSSISSNTSTIAVRGVIANPEGKILPGQFVRVLVKGILWKKAAVIPERAVIKSAQGEIVYVLDKEQKVTIRPVVLGNYFDRSYIVDSGLQEGDMVIVEGMIKVHPGQNVNITKTINTKLLNN